MPEVTFLPSGKVLSVLPHAELLEAARAAGLEHDAPCGGRGTCGKCVVRVVSGDVDTTGSAGLLTATALAAGHVLACKTRLGTGDATVDVPPASGRDGGQIAGDAMELVRAELLPKPGECHPVAVKRMLDVPPPRAEDGLSDFDRVMRSVQRDCGPMEIACGVATMRDMADALRSEGGLVTVTMNRAGGRARLLRIEAGDRTRRHYGIAVDVGTTTVSIQLVDLALPTIVGTRSDYNDQVACGLDVISRINYAQRPERLAELRERVLATINRLTAQAVASHPEAAGNIANAVISGNTTMVHMLLGLKPEYIRLEPYTPTVMQVPYVTAAEVGLAINPGAWVHFSPAVGSYVGGDITAGVLCTDLATGTPAVNLFIDIGTNGELVLGNDEFLLACACSAGPAFEGGGIDCGMRAARGAIERVEVSSVDGTSRFWTIGNVRPRGICGSGMISLLASLLRTGWIDPAGKLCRTRPSPAIEISGRRARYVVAPASESGLGTPIVVSELDIDNIVRAKAAIYSACALLLQHAGLSSVDLANVFIGGGFGRFLDLEDAVTIGLVPDLQREQFRYIGNCSLTGSYMLLVSEEARERQRALASRITYLDLSSDPQYMDAYTAALFLPHTDRRQFPSLRWP